MRAPGLTRLHELPTAGGGIARLVCERMREARFQFAPLLSKAGLTIGQIEDRSARLTVKSQVQFLELAAAALRDDFLGFHIARSFDLREIGLLYYVFASSQTLADALHKAERYSGIVNEGISLRVRDGRETAITLSYIGIDRLLDQQQIEFWLTTLVRLCRQLTNWRLVPLRIRVMHHRPKMPAELKSFLGCAIEFGSNVDEVVFSRTVKTMSVISADPYLNALLLKICEEAISRRTARGTTLRSGVERAIALLLPHGKAKAADVARHVGVSGRTLARRLSLEGLTLSGILNELKADLAMGYLRKGNLPISRVAWLLGYREISAFTHAFKRWTGVSPREFRAKPNGLSINNRDRKKVGKLAHR